MNILPINKFISILNSQQRYSKISFGEKPLYNINLKKRQENDEYVHTSGTFSQIDPNNEDDEQLVTDIKENWGVSSYSYEIAEEFLHPYMSKNSSFYIVKQDTLTQTNNTTCIASTTNVDDEDKSIFEIEYIQSSPEIAFEKDSKIKGSGEIMIYGCVKEAQKYGFEKVAIFSANDSFYKHIGLNKSQNNWFELPSSKYDEFVERIEKKYKIK